MDIKKINHVEEMKKSLDDVEFELYRYAQALYNTEGIIVSDFLFLQEDWPNNIKMKIESNNNWIKGKIIVNGEERQINKSFQLQAVEK